VSRIAPELLILYGPCQACRDAPDQHLTGGQIDACLAWEKQQSERFERLYNAIEQLEREHAAAQQENADLRAIVYRLKTRGNAA
jgi:hypothetical protein